MRVATRFKNGNIWVILYDHSSPSNGDDFELVATTNENDPSRGMSSRVRGTLEEVLKSELTSGFSFTSVGVMENEGLRKMLKEKALLYITASKKSYFTMTPGYWIQLSATQLDEALLELGNSAHLRQIIRELTWALTESQRSIEYYKGRLEASQNTLNEIQIKAQLGVDPDHDRR